MGGLKDQKGKRGTEKTTRTPNQGEGVGKNGWGGFFGGFTREKKRTCKGKGNRPSRGMKTTLKSRREKTFHRGQKGGGGGVTGLSKFGERRISERWEERVPSTIRELGKKRGKKNLKNRVKRLICRCGGEKGGDWYSSLLPAI